MLREPPKLTYNGLTIIMSNPSRFDGPKKNPKEVTLLTGVAGVKYNDDCLRPETNRYCTDIRLIDDKSPLLPNTKCILLLGQRALTLHTGATTSLNEQRGSPLIDKDGIVCIPSYNVQDAYDIIDHEKNHNPLSRFNLEISEFSAGREYDEKSHGKTSRANYIFWLKADTKKAWKIIDNNGKLPKEQEPTYHIRPSSDTIIDGLNSFKSTDLHFDMETDFITRDMRCFAFSSGDNPTDIYITPTLDINYRPCYGNLPQIIKALGKAINRNCLVAHNGACFDFLVLATKYGINIPRNVFDTMIAQHRIFPDVEKSLGHCGSYWTFEPYHKNEGLHAYRTPDQAHQLYQYCGKDVWMMYLVKKAQMEFAKTVPGLEASISQAMASIRPYLTMTLTGIAYNQEKLLAKIRDNDRLMTQYVRIIQILTGPKVDPLISNKSCNEYFTNLLHYPPASFTESGKPAFNEESLIKLALAHNNPVIQFLIAYRKRQKETGALQFTPWINPPITEQDK